MAALIPFIVFIARRYPLETLKSTRSALVHIGAAITFATVNLLMTSFLSDYVFYTKMQTPFISNLWRLFGIYFIGLMVQYFNVQPFIATLAMMFLARGLASMLSTTPVQAPEGSPIHLLATDWKLIDGPKVNDLTITPGLLIAVLVVLGGMFYMHRSRSGRTVYAIGGSESSAGLMGLPVARTRVGI